MGAYIANPSLAVPQRTKSRGFRVIVDFLPRGRFFRLACLDAGVVGRIGRFTDIENKFDILGQ